MQIRRVGFTAFSYVETYFKIDYGVGRILFAGEVAGFLNPMGEGISCGMENRIVFAA